MKTNKASAMNEPVVTVSKLVAGAPDDVFAAWTEAEQIEKWFGPPGYAVHARELDARVGGSYELIMQPPESAYPTRSIVGTYKEVSAPQRLVFTWAWVDATGALPDDGESLVSIEFRAVADGTEVHISHEKLGSEESRAGHLAGWTGSLEKLAGHFE